MSGQMVNNQSKHVCKIGVVSVSSFPLRKVAGFSPVSTANGQFNALIISLNKVKENQNKFLSIIKKYIFYN